MLKFFYIIQFLIKILITQELHILLNYNFTCKDFQVFLCYLTVSFVSAFMFVLDQYNIQALKSQKGMNFLFVPNVEQIPQWQQCYYDKKTIAYFFEFFIDCKQTMEKVNSLKANCQIENQRRFYSQSSDRIQELLQISRSCIYKYHTQEQKIVANFIQLKIFQIQKKYKIYQALVVVIGYKSHNMSLLLQNLFIQAYYLDSATLSNIREEKQILEKMNEDSQQFPRCLRLLRTKKQTLKLKQDIELKYNIYQQKLDHSLSFQKIKIQLSRNKNKELNFIYIGGFMGLMFCFIGILLMMSNISHINLTQSEIFASKFPVWRGAFELTFYIWILGIDVLFYQRSKINYKLLFHLNGINFPRSSFFFSVASTFSLVLLVLMLLFFMKISGIIQTDFVHFGQLFWLILLVYIFQPIKIFGYKTRFHWLKATFKAFFFCFFQMNFVIIWVAEQTVSLSQPTTDLFYTFFNFFANNRTLSSSVTANFNTAVVMLFALQRVGQNLKIWLLLCRKTSPPVYNFWHPPFLGLLRGVFGFFAALASLTNRLKLFSGALPFYIVMVILATFMGWYADVRGDGGLLQNQPYFLKQRLHFSNNRLFYYLMICLIFIFRIGWALTVAPFYLSGTTFQNSLFVMVVCFVQIMRRGVWNILRAENEHGKNCLQYQATVRDNVIFQEIKGQVKFNKLQENHNDMSEQQINTQEQLESPTRKKLIKSLKYLKKVTIQSQSKRHEEKIIQQRLKFQLELLKDGIKMRKKLRNEMLSEFQQYQKQIKMIKKRIFLGHFSKKFISQQ